MMRKLRNYRLCKSDASSSCAYTVYGKDSLLSIVCQKNQRLSLRSVTFYNPKLTLWMKKPSQTYT